MHNKSQGLMLLKTASLLDGIPQHIYITSDEEIKAGYYLDLADNSIVKVSEQELKLVKPYDKLQFKNIILTTDTILIADGVQAIDDKFLEWFVKNASCESVEVKNYKSSEYPLNYKIIIPQEEPKK